MAYDFHIQTQVRVSPLITDIHTSNVSLFHSSDYTVTYTYSIFRIDANFVPSKNGYTHQETLSKEVYETLLEAETAYHVLCFKSFVRLNEIDKNSDLSSLEQEKGY